MTSNLTGVISSAYDLSSVLRVCIRALEGDARYEPGDNVATASTVRKAQEMAGDVIDSLERLETEANRSQLSDGPEDCASVMVDQWKAARKAREAVLRSLGPHHKDDPAELESLDELLGALGGKISHCNPQSHADAAAMLEWCILDCGGEILCDDYPRVQQAVIDYLRTA
ncbi:hypothetical protein [Sulfitobacter pontiacus]|uniref:hypothetical protein n=1 Tax=Sulfitobacter pontiacus TaxID=60137 RepID=UPI0030EEDFE8